MSKLIPMIQIEVKDGQTFCDSLQVAERFSKRHEYVLKTIKRLELDLSNMNKITGVTIKLSSYVDSTNKSNVKYLLNRKAFTLVTNRFKGELALEWQSKFFDAFEEMEKVISGQLGNWAKARRLVKEVRRTMTDRVQDYVALAVSQGSETYKTRPQLAYSNMTKMTNKALGITDKRDDLPELKLSQLSVTENRIGEILDSKIKNNEPYKEIFQDTKTEVAKIAVALGVATPEQKRITSASS
jgi:Rha family phage regulatory protein